MMPRKKPSIIASVLAIVGIIVFVALAWTAVPLIALLAGMFVGLVLEWFTGDYVVQAFNAIGMSGVKSGDLPKVFGLIAVVATLVKVGASNAVKSKASIKAEKDFTIGKRDND